MRSQASKPSPKKGALNKATLKAGSPAKQAKKKPVSPKKVKTLVTKSLVKSPKRSIPKDDGKKSDADSSSEEKSDLSPDPAKTGPSKGSSSRSESPSKKPKKDATEKKESVKNNWDSNAKKLPSKKIIKLPKKTKVGVKSIKDDNDVKYKINVNVAKKAAAKYSKVKTVLKKGNTNQKKKNLTQKSLQSAQKDESKDDKDANCKDVGDEELLAIQDTTDNVSDKNNKDQATSNENMEAKSPAQTGSSITPTSALPVNNPEATKTEVERPPKFFTSSRSQRTVDIDVKCFKNSKGNLSVSERFLSMKCETKTDDPSKDRSASSNLISQGPEIDVYTFTEKVDSPKSILSDFRSPMNRNVGRVRPIARVKGTVIDRKTDTEKKKYSPHRPIEEVVKQLKANKRSEELKTSETQDDNGTSSLESITSSDKDIEEKPKPIVSKSYKMVARKSSVTGKPFSPIKFLDQETSATKNDRNATAGKKNVRKKKSQKKTSLSDDELDTCTFALNTKSFHYSSSEESVSESNDDNDTKDSGSDTSKTKKTKNKKYKRITDISKKTTSKELKELSKDSLIDLKDDSTIAGNDKPSKRRLKLLSMWSGPKKHRMASLNAIAKVHCLYENESRTHMELGLMRTVDRQPIPSTSKSPPTKKKETKCKEIEKQESTSESEYENRKDKKDESSESSDDNPPQRSLRGEPGIRSAGKYWDPKSCTSSSEESELDSRKKSPEKKKASPKSSAKSDSEKPPAKMKKTAGVPVKKKRNRNEVVMDLKDMVVQKRMASLNATAILAASYEKRSPKSSKDDTTSDSCSDESFSQKSKNGVSSGVKSEVKLEDTQKESSEEGVVPDRKQKVEVIVNQDTDVTITGVYSTHHHEGFCTVSGMQYRISSTSHTQTTATANCEKEGCPREDGARYTPLSALSSMQPPPDHAHSHPHPVPELGGLARRAGCSSAFSAPSPSGHHEPGYYQPAGPLIKETGADAERALARYHPPPHYHAPHPPVLQQYGPPYYPPDLCYGRYYRPAGPPYHMPPQPDAQMVGVGSEPYPPPPPQYYGTPPCYQHSPQRIPYVEYRGCPCPLNACPKNVLIGPATGKAPAGGGPADVPSALAPPGGAFRAKVRACALDAGADTHGSGKDPPLGPEPPAAADAPHPCPLPAIGGASPKREMFDVRDNRRLPGDIPGPAEPIGPPSPARGSAGACAPQPPPVVPRRARLGKEMARRTLAGDDTGLLLTVPQRPMAHHSDADDDVMAISPPVCAPIDLSSSDERSTPLVDVKKENEGPTCATSRKTDAQALREHNCTTTFSNVTETNVSPKAVKRRYSRPKLEIDMKDSQLEDVCRTNGIGEHVKLQKRRKVSGEQSVVSPRTETTVKEVKKRPTQTVKKQPKTPVSEKKTVKRKSDSNTGSPKAKKMLLLSPTGEDQRLKKVSTVIEDPSTNKPKNKSALLLDNLIRKNSIDSKIVDKEINPAELFLPPGENGSPNFTKKSLNINNNIVENSPPISGVRPNTIAAVSQLIEKKLAYKNSCKVEKVDSKITHNMKSVLKSAINNNKLNLDDASNVKYKINEEAIAPLDKKVEQKLEPSEVNQNEHTLEDAIVSFKVSKPQSCYQNETNSVEESQLTSTCEKKHMDDKPIEVSKTGKNKQCKSMKIGQMKSKSIEKVAKLLGSKKPVSKEGGSDKAGENLNSNDKVDGTTGTSFEDTVTDQLVQKRNKMIANKDGDLKGKSIEKVAKLLVSKKPTSKTDEKTAEEPNRPRNSIESSDTLTVKDQSKTDKIKRCKLSNGDLKAKNVEKVVKLLVSKKPAIKTDEATLVIEDACASPLPTVGRRARRRRSGAGIRRVRRQPPPLAPPSLEPRAPPRWSNGWQWDGEHYLSKVYLNNDSRLDRTARCWSRMTHASGDSVARGDCVLLRASTARAQPFVARVASLWENPEDGEMMVSLVWYYRPEHTERGREPADAPDEVFASRHRDANSVACIEDKCYVLTFNEYCRYRKRLKAAEEGVTIKPSIVPPLPASEVTPAVAPNDCKLPPSVAPDLVLFCRKIYDFRSKKIQVPNK